MHVCMYKHRVLYRKMVALSQLCLILLSGDVAVNLGPLRLGFANCCSIRNKSPVVAKKVKMVGMMSLADETHIKAHDTPFFLQELTPKDSH